MDNTTINSTENSVDNTENSNNNSMEYYYSKLEDLELIKYLNIL